MSENTPSINQQAIESVLSAMMAQHKERAMGQVSHMLTYCVDFNPNAYQNAYNALVEDNDPTDFGLFADQSTFLGACKEPLIEQWVEERLAKKGTRKSKLQVSLLTHLYVHSDFLEAILSELFTKAEGRACSADKSRTVLRHWAALIAGDIEAIKWNYEAQYTYHLPKKILTTEDSIEQFFTATLQLLAGKPLPFASFVANELAKAAQV